MKKKLLIIPIIMAFVLCINIKVKALAPDDVPTRSYIIGTHLFTRRPAEGSPYGGTLTTQWIMYASGTIMSADLNDRIIYYKDSEGNWYNAIDDNPIEVDDDFYIEYKDGVRFYEIPVPELAQDMIGPDEEHMSPDLIITGGQVCALLHINSAELAGEIEGFTVFDATDDTEVETPEQIDAHVVVCGDQGSSGSYYAKAIITGDEGEPVYGDKSNVVEVEFTMDITAPELAQDMTGPDAEHLTTPDLFVKNEQICGLVHINSSDLEGIVDGFAVYKSDDTLVENSAQLDAHITVCADQGTSYYARTYKTGTDNTKVYSGKSGNVDVDFTMDIPAPVLAQDMTGPDGEHQSAEYIIVNGKVCANIRVNEADLTGKVDGYVVYNSDNTVFATPAELSSPVQVCDIDGTELTYYAKTYIEGTDHTKVYSTKSNDLSIDFSELHLVTAAKIDATNRNPGDPEGVLNNINNYSVMKVADDTILVTDNGLVPYIGGNQTTEKKWVGIIVDFGVEVQGTGYTIEPIDRADAISWGASTNTAFVLWTITDNDRTITFTDVNDANRTFDLKINFETDD